MTKAWLRAATGVAVGGVLVTSIVLAPTAGADPDAVTQAQVALERIHEQSSAIDAAYTEAKARLDQATVTLKAAEADVITQRTRVSGVKVSIATLARANFQSAGVDITARLMTSPDDSTFLGQLATIQSVNARSNDKLQEYQLEQATLTRLEQTAKGARDQIATETARQQQLAADYDKKEAEAQQVLARLTAQEKKRLADLEAKRIADAERAAQVAATQTAPGRAALSRGAERTPASSPASQQSNPAPVAAPQAPQAPVAASGRGAAAVAFAMAQVGKAYVMGGTGPSAYDCSGLTSVAWASAGVRIPRTSQAQFGAGTPVSAGSMQPGDLVFYYSGISHVGMYIGNGQIVHAANPRSGVKVTSLYSMPFMGARRVG